MPDVKQIDNSALEALLDTFAKERNKESYAKVMEALEKTTVFVPILMPEGLDPAEMEKLKSGAGTKVSGTAKITPCLLKKDTGEQVLPIFSSKQQATETRKSPAVLALPFFKCVDLVMTNKDKIQGIVLNPFAQNMFIGMQMLEVAEKRSKLAQAPKVQLTAEQFHQLADRRICLEMLPAFLFEKGREGLDRLQHEEGQFLLSQYQSVYPAQIKVPYRADDFSLLTLNITEDIQVTRLDMPERKGAVDACRRVYAVWDKTNEALSYYTVEATKDGLQIGQVDAERKHALLEPLPENGVEIERIVSLASHRQN